MDRIPKPGEFYRHFKNRMYQVLQIASHTETGEKLVIYQALYGDFGVYARPLEQFAGPVDSEKYPDVRQKYRFEQVYLKADGQSETVQSGERAGEAQEPSRIQSGERAIETQEADHLPAGSEKLLSPLVLEFLDAETYEEKLFVLQKMKGKVDQRDLDSLSLTLDLAPGQAADKTQEEQLKELEQYVRMQQHYDASRLRRR